MTDAERPDQPDEEQSADAAAPEEAEAEAGRAVEADADEDLTADNAAEEPAADVVDDEPPAAEAGEPAGSAPEADEDSSTETEDVETGESAPEPSESARPATTGGEESIPGAHLEPDLVLEQPPATNAPDYSRYAETDPEAELEAEAAAAGDPDAASAPTDREDPAPEPRAVLDLGPDARYRATGKRKTAVARVILRPGNGTYTINGRKLEQFFPRVTLQLAARQPLHTSGFEDRMDVVARLHGGGVSAQAGALRHGIARALVEADPALRGELKRHGFLTRDARAKERKKAGLKKARKRPQFSKR